jgi:hypothetical protein
MWKLQRLREFGSKKREAEIKFFREKVLPEVGRREKKEKRKLWEDNGRNERKKGRQKYCTCFEY